LEQTSFCLFNVKITAGAGSLSIKEGRTLPYEVTGNGRTPWIYLMMAFNISDLLTKLDV
jgi:hypothetical protein